MPSSFLRTPPWRRCRRRPGWREHGLPAVVALEERTLLSPFPPNIQNNLGAYLSPLGVISGFPTTVTPGETVSFVVNISPNGVDSSFDGGFGYPFVAMSYVEKNSLLINFKQPDHVSDNGLTTFYLYPYSPGIPPAPPDEPDPVNRFGDQQAVPIQVFSSTGDGSGMPITGPSVITVTIASDAPAGTVTEVPSQSAPGTFDAPGPWVYVVGDYFDSNDQQHAWSTAIPFVVAPNVPFFPQEAFFGGGNPTPEGGAGTPLAPSVVVDVLGNGGAVNTSYNGNVTITLNGGAQGASLLGPGGSAVSSVTVQAVNGVATFQGPNAIIVNQSGTGYTLNAALDDGTSNPSPDFNIKSHTVKFATQPANATAGDPLPVGVEVDTGGAIDTGFTGPVQLQLADQNGNPLAASAASFVDQHGGSLGTTITATASGGTADFSKLLRINKAGTYTLIASLPNEPNAPSVTSSSITLSDHQLAIQLPSPMGGLPGQALPAVQVIVKDSQGNTDLGYDADVVLALHGGTAGGQDNGAALSGGTQPASGGIATFSNLVIGQSGLNYTLTATLATDPGPNAPSTQFSVGHTLNFLTQPPGSPGGTPNEPLGAPPLTSNTPTPVQVEVDDTTGKRDTHFSGVVLMTLAANSAGASVGGKTSVPVSDGVATFSTLSVNKVGSGYVLIANLQPSEPTAAPAMSNAFNIVPHDLIFNSVLPAPPTRAGASGAPVLAPGGGPLQVEALDAQGNVDQGYSSQITITLNTISLLNPGSKPATLLDASGNPVTSVTTTASAGIVSFKNVIISEPGQFTLTASANEPGALPGGMISDTSGPFNIGHDTPVITSQPSGFAGVKEPVGSVVVQVQDDSGKVDTGFTGNVTMTLLGLASSGQSPFLGGAVTQQARAGMATYNNLTVNFLGDEYQLGAALADGTQSTPSDLFSIVPEVFKFIQTSFPNPAGVPDLPLNPPIQVQAYLKTGSGDSDLMPDTQFAGTITLALGQNAAGATLTNPSQNSGSSGVYTFASLAFSKPSGQGNPGFTLTPSDGTSSDTGVASSPIVIAPHGLTFDPSKEPGNVVAGIGMSQVVVVDVTDLAGNPDPNYSGVVTLTVVGGEFLDPTTLQTVGSLTANVTTGRALFQHPIIAAPGSYQLSATITEPGSAAAYSTPFVVTPGALQTAPVSQNLSASKSTVAVGQSFNLTDKLTINGASPMVVVAGIVPRGALTAAKTRTKGKPHPTGTVLFEDGSTPLKSVKVKVVHGVAEATAKLKLTTPGVQTINAIYTPDAQSQRLGFSALVASTKVNVLPAGPKMPGGKKHR
jgi:hypothetical protein